MTDKSRHNDRKETDLFEQFPANERAKMQEIWEKSANAEIRTPEVTDRDTENALSAVHSHINDSESQHFSKGTGIHFLSWKWVAAAAVILLISGAGYLFIPKTVTAPRGKMASVTLPDGSTVELNSGSNIEYNRLFDITNRDITLDGEAFFSVEKGEEHFIVSANHARVEVLGTKFNVRSWSNEPGQRTEVTVTEGAVHLYPAGLPDSSVIIHPGNLSALSANMNKPTEPRSVSLERITGWRNHRLTFNNQSLQVIFNELERRFNTKIQLEAKDVANETLTAFYNNPQNVGSVLKDICQIKRLRFSKTAHGYRVYK
ncbi:MAG TPA: FecR domain-containing protein [Balneolaceae bacterium]|nr:FecR domain-containing protein [Balneolaceae bacterium]